MKMGQIWGKVAEVVRHEIGANGEVAEAKPLQRRELSVLAVPIVVTTGMVEHIVGTETDDRKVPQVGQTPEYPEVYVVCGREICEGFQGVSVLGDDPAHGILPDIWAVSQYGTKC